LVVVAALGVVSTPLAAQEAVPMLINYQGELRDPGTGDPLEGTYDILLRIYNDPTDTSPTALVWNESHLGVEVEDGKFSVILGSATALSATDFSGPDRWLEMQVGAETLSPRQRMTSAAYSIVSENSRLLDGKEASEFAGSTHPHSGSDITSGTVAEARIDPAISRDSERDAAITAHAAISNAHHARYTDAEAVAAMGTKSPNNPLNHDKTTTFPELTGTAADGQIPASIARDSEIMPTVLANDGTGSGLDADKLDGAEAAALEESGEIDADIGTHAGDAGAHHTKTTSFSDLTDTATDAQIPDNISINYAAEAGNADTVDGMEGADLEESAEIDADIGTHAGDAGAHHTKTTSFSDLTDTATDAQIAASIARDSEIMPTVLAADGTGSTLDADLLDGIDSTGLAAAVHNHDGTYWRLTGDGGTSAGTDFLGTIDNQALELRVNNARALRLEPNKTSPNLIGGYETNSITAGVAGAAIAGGGGAGEENRVTDDFGTVGGGRNNLAGDGVGTTSDNPHNTVAGGYANTAVGGSATVGGGYRNTATGYVATVGGGTSNTASAYRATVSGGNGNDATADGCTVGGGNGNTASGAMAAVGGGTGNTASGYRATVGGGDRNAASHYATVPGGSYNTAAGNYSFAAGRRAAANHDGTLVWADSQDAGIASTTADEVTFRCKGGVRFISGSGGANQLVAWAPGSSSWTFSSDRNLKENFVEVDARDVLDKLSALPIAEWNFKGYPNRHIGPIAQDFHALFPLGGSDTMIDSGDLQGVALAAIQGLHKIVKEKNAKISSLEARIEALETLVKKLAESQVGGEE